LPEKVAIETKHNRGIEDPEPNNRWGTFLNIENNRRPQKEKIFK
jgi:hypothetical protein